MMHTELPVVELREVSFGYARGVPVVQEVSVPVQAGRVHALIGPNASGKTTLVKLMLGLLRPWGGRVRRHPRGTVLTRTLRHAGGERRR